ncbi:MAG: type II secretion system protein [Candidatus Nitronauta litoralis]|uniref:Type II secretion system protein n=1 Tax=Candidatus Nitronauta litoralis TaxID=2705533 RepID=A0A7T0G0M5_9BACT|nr:MAG: type II secretion system protein [Candidatus Nitronauta litoralis]
MKENRETGFTLIELLVVIAIIGILTAIAIPQFNAYKIRSYDANAKSSLRQLFMACKSYWIDSDSLQNCTVAVASIPTYGFIPSAGVTLVPVGNESNFSASAQHISSPNSFSVDSTGTVR